MSDYELAKAIRNRLLTDMAEVLCYKWSDEFSLQQIRKSADDIKGLKGYRPVDVNKLTLDEMDLLGFGRWSESDPTFRLISLWLYPFLAEDVHTYDIGGGEHHTREELDTDHRFGSLAYGVKSI